MKRFTLNSVIYKPYLNHLIINLKGDFRHNLLTMNTHRQADRKNKDSMTIKQNIHVTLIFIIIIFALFQ